jgi:ABC-2 type transport system permease protein
MEMNNIFLKNVLLKTLNDNRFQVLAWSIGILLYILMIMSFYQSLGDSTDYAELIATFSPEIMKMFMMDTIAYGPISFLNGQLYSLMLPLFFIIFNTLFASGAIATEEKKGQLDLILSTPIPRWKFLLEKFVAMLIFNLILGFISFLGIWLGAIVVDASLNMWHVAAVSISLIGLGIFFGGLGICASGVTGNKQISLGITGGFGVLSYMLHTMALLSTDYTSYQRISPFYYYINNNPLVNGLDIIDFSVLIISAIVFLIIALIIFQRRDLVTNQWA